MIITMQQRTITITDPSEAKEMDLEFTQSPQGYLKLRRRHNGISINR